MAGRSLVSRLPLALIAARSSSLAARRSSPLLFRLRPLASSFSRLPLPQPHGGDRLRCFSTRATTSSLKDPSPNWSNRPPTETILLDGCDFEHWLVVLEPPDPSLTRDDIIDSYIKTLAMVVGSEEEAKMKIYSVSTKHYFAFGALVSEELSFKLKELPKVRWVLPDSYLDVPNKDYGGEPFINGEAVPYDPKYHEEWVRNNARSNERSRRTDRPRNYDRSRNFERRRENMQNFQNRDVPPPPVPNQNFQSNVPPPPVPNRNFQSNVVQNPMPPRDVPPPAPGSQGQNAIPPRDIPPPPMQNRDFNQMPPRDNRNIGGMPNSNAQSAYQHSGMPNMPNRDYQNQMPNPQTSYLPNRDGGGFPNNYGFQSGGQGYQGGNEVGGMQGGGPGYQGGGPGYQGGGPGGNAGYQGNYPGNQAGNPYYQGGTQSYQGGSPTSNAGGATHPGNNPGGYQGPSSTYQAAGEPPAYQGNPGNNPGGYQGPSSTYQAAGEPLAYQGRDMPGRDSQ